MCFGCVSSFLASVVAHVMFVIRSCGCSGVSGLYRYGGIGVFPHQAGDLMGVVIRLGMKSVAFFTARLFIPLSRVILE